MILPFQKAGILVAADEVQVLAPGLASAVVRFAPTVDVAPVGTPLVLRVQDVTGASPTGYVEATIAAGAKVATPGTGSFNVAAGATVYVRVVSGPVGANAASWLSGYFETSGADAGTAFCTVADLKTFAGITGSTYDAELGAIIARVTGAMQAWIGRLIVETTYTAERHSFYVANTKLVLLQRPLISVQEVRVDGTAISASDYVAQLGEGILYAEGGWSSGSYHIEVDYTAGYASVPPALVDACLRQSRYEWTLAKHGGDRFGLAQRAEASGGSTAFVVEDWYPGVLAAMRAYRRLA